MKSPSRSGLFSFLQLLVPSLAIMLQPPGSSLPLNPSIEHNETLRAGLYKITCATVPGPPFSLLSQDCEDATFKWFAKLPEPITESELDFQWTHKRNQGLNNLTFPASAQHGGCRLTVDYKYSKLIIGKIPPFDVIDFGRRAGELNKNCVQDVRNDFVDGGTGYWNPPYQPLLTVIFKFEKSLVATNNSTSVSRGMSQDP